ncbi:MAG: SDR family oxidoreductase [Spirochaetaceae bacterium]|nr:SDR family oxidoreductase [Spirochaetaceae bacterium]MCF7951955.1 SDR family oxidoreductase [Spirochaetaceae bacterium]
MKVLFIGGTGTISSACIREAVSRGVDVYVYNRGNSNEQLPEGVTPLKGDIRDRSGTVKALAGYRFDVVINWVAFTEEHVAQDIDFFSGKVGQYVYISSASAYSKPPAGTYVTEGTLLRNPFWQYSRDKIACEERLIKAWRETGFPVTIVRPSHTYGEKMIPSIFDRGPTIVDRIINGKPIIVPGDGTSRWTLTHNSDFAKGFVGLLGNPAAVGEAFHITSDEALTWDQVHHILGMKLGRPVQIVHMPADYICERYPEFTGPLKGDKIHTALFDNSKIKRLVPAFRCTTPFHLGIEASLQRLKKNPEENIINEDLNSKLDDLLKRYKATIEGA